LNYSTKKNKICAVVPFYNEQTTLSKLLLSVSNYVDCIIAVDDGSTDKYTIPEEVFEKVSLIQHPKNLGKGAAIRSGFKKSVELKTGTTIIIDADGQHDPKFIPYFIEKISEFDIVVGNRLFDMKFMPIHRRASNLLTSKLLSIKTGIKILDSQCGFRAYRTNILNTLLPDFTGFEAESEILIKAAKAKFSIGYVDVPTIYGNDDSKMNSVAATLGFIKVLLS